MSEFKHTPGPWEVREIELHEGGTGIEVVGANGDVICDNQTYYPCAVSRKNANLIAAAPELLEALIGLDEAYCRAGDELTGDERAEDRKRLIAARAAIAKATGE